VVKPILVPCASGADASDERRSGTASAGNHQASSDALLAIVRHVIGRVWPAYEDEEDQSGSTAAIVGKQRPARRRWLT
jgi:hypothetical protein